ncbi:MAG: ParA family protein [Caulobacter sp.]
MKTLAVISRKGGAGKTTLSINLALAAHLAGRRTILADIDPQRSASDVLRGRPIEGPVLMESSAGKLFQARYHAEHEGCDLMVIDTPAAPDTDVVTAINAADLCLLVCRPTFLDIAAVARSAEAVRRLGKSGLIVLNQAPAKRGGFEPSSVVKAAEALRFCGLPLAAVGLRSRAAFQQSFAHGRSVLEWEPAGAAAQEMGRLWGQIAAQLHLTQEDRAVRVG